MGRLREKCGALTGGFMVLGLKYGNTDPKDLDTKLASYKKVRILNKQMLNDYGSADCSDILKKTCNKSGSSRPKTSQDHLSRDCW
jgi:hypothetical protein